MNTSLRHSFVVIVLMLGLAACSGDDDPSGDGSLPVVTSLPASATPTASSAPSSSVATTPVDADVPSTASATPTATEPAAPNATSAPVDSTPVTTEPLSVQELVLTGEGLGSAVFGAEPQAVIDYVSSILGNNTADTGWVAPDEFGDCSGNIARRVDWGTLSLIFTDLSPIANGRQHFIGFEYGRVGEIGDEPVGLRTPGGIALGSRVVDLLAEFPDAAVNAGDAQVGLPDNFYVSNVFYGLLTGTTGEDFVTVLFGGYGCGE
jgi:hypothetical protein